MNLLLFSDLHDSSRGLNAILDYLNKNQNISGLVFAGDLTNMGEPVEFAQKFINEISKFNLPLLWVPGNNDFGQSYKVLQNHTLSLEGRIVKIGGRGFTGIGGSPASWSGQYEGENSLSKEEIAGTILVSHYPPAGVRYAARNNSQDTITKQISNLKSQNCHCEEFARLARGEPRRTTRQSDVCVILSEAKDLNNRTVKQSNPSTPSITLETSLLGASNKIRLADAPLAHICGHIHHTQGIGSLGQTKVIKLASSAQGNIAIMNLENLGVEFMRLI